MMASSNFNRYFKRNLLKKDIIFEYDLSRLILMIFFIFIGLILSFAFGVRRNRAKDLKFRIRSRKMIFMINDNLLHEIFVLEIYLFLGKIYRF